MEILVGEHANDYAQIAAKDKLTELQLRMRQLLDQVDQITKEQAYQRVRNTKLIPYMDIGGVFGNILYGTIFLPKEYNFWTPVFASRVI